MVFLGEYLVIKGLKAETQDETNRGDTLLQQLAFIGIFVAATEFCRCDQSHQFKLV